MVSFVTVEPVTGFSLEKMQVISHAGRNLQRTLCPTLTLTTASVEKKC